MVTSPRVRKERWRKAPRLVVRKLPLLARGDVVRAIHFELEFYRTNYAKYIC